MLGGIGQRLVAAHLPLAHRRNDFQVGGKCLECDIESHLIVALTGATMRHCGGIVGARGIDHQFGNEWPAKCCRQRVFTFVKCARCQRGKYEAVHEQVACILRYGVNSTCFQRFLANLLKVARATEIYRECHNVQVVLFLDPRDHDGGI